jgi:hypothetical protein
MIDSAAIRVRWETFGSKLDERGRRLFAAAEVRAAGRGGLALVSKITGLARSTINRGEDDLDAAPFPTGRIRRKGGGRHALGDRNPGLREALHRLVDPDTFGDPMRPLVWVSKSLEKLATALTSMGFPVGIDTVRTELRKLGFSRQGNRKAEEGSNHADRDTQFQYINATVLAAQGHGEPVVSVDTKKKELIGNFKNAGTDYRPEGEPLRVNVHDFEDKTLGKVAPYGVDDVTANEGSVSLGITSDTAEFAVASIRCWAGAHGAPALSRRNGVDDHRRLRRFERGAGSAVESPIAGAGRRDGTDAPRPPLSARDVEMEQDQASPVLSHHTELARSSVDGSPRCRRADRRDDDENRPDGQLRY